MFSGGDMMRQVIIF